MDNSQPDYFIVAVILTAVVYMFFPIIKIITNHGNLFERKRAKRIALWNSVVVGAVFCLLTSAFIGPWSAAPAFIYYWINSAILTEKSKKEGSDAVQAKEDNIENVGKPTSDETVVGNAIQSENTANINPVKQETNDQPYVKPYNTESIIQPLVSEISATDNKKPGKSKYCSRCGQLIDRKTKKCTGCGRQSYSIINISNLLKSLSLYKPEILKKLNGAIGYFGYVIWILLTSLTIYMPLCVIGENYKISAVGVILISALLQGLSVLPFLEIIYETALWVWIIVIYNDVSKLLMPFHWIGFVLYIGMTLIPLFRRLYVYVRDR